MSNQMPAHEFLYGVGTAGLGRLGIPDRSPGWYCACGGWSMAAVAKPMQRTGNNRVQAHRAWSQHASPP